jgi:hypothetical protein
MANDQSSLNSFTGSTRMALSAGRQAAASAVTAIVPITPAHVTGSAALTPY